MKNVLEFDIKARTTQKDYMHGFQGFANVVKKINQKLSKNKFVNELDAWAVDVDYDSTIPVVEQINKKVISAIKRIQHPVLNMMSLYGIEDISLFCGTIDSVDDICSIYQTMSKQNLIKLDTTQVTDYQMKINEEEMMRRLTNLALEFIMLVMEVVQSVTATNLWIQQPLLKTLDRLVMNPTLNISMWKTSLNLCQMTLGKTTLEICFIT